MPLTKKGEELKRIFEKEYGKNRGNQIYYAYENKHPEMGLTYKNRSSKWFSH